MLVRLNRSEYTLQWKVAGCEVRRVLLCSTRASSMPQQARRRLTNALCRGTVCPPSVKTGWPMRLFLFSRLGTADRDIRAGKPTAVGAGGTGASGVVEAGGTGHAISSCPTPGLVHSMERGIAVELRSFTELARAV